MHAAKNGLQNSAHQVIETKVRSIFGTIDSTNWANKIAQAQVFSRGENDEYC